MKFSFTTAVKNGAIGATVLLSAITLVGCSLIQQAANKPADSSSTGTAGETSKPSSDPVDSDVFDIKVGECLNETSGTTVSTVPKVACTEPHDFEVYYDFNLSGGSTYPGDAAITEQANDGCEAPFTTFIGIPYADSALDVNTYTPTKRSWEEGNDRKVSCLVSSPDGQTTGTLKGSAK